MQDVHRAQRRVTRTEEVIKRAQEQRAVHVAEVEEAEQRLLSLQEDAAHPPPCRRLELLREIEELVREREGVEQGMPWDAQGEWFADNIPDLTTVPPAFKRNLRDVQRLGVRGGS